jgi:hypothetical protein
MNQDNEQDFVTNHPAIHAELQRVLRPSPLRADFPAQVRARLVPFPLQVVRKLLRIELSLRIANIMATSIVIVIACWAAWPRLETLSAAASAQLSQSPAAVIAGIAAAGLLWLAARDPRMLS